LILKTAIDAGKSFLKKGPKGHKGRTNRESVLLSFWSFMSFKSFGLKTVSESNYRF